MQKQTRNISNRKSHHSAAGSKVESGGGELTLDELMEGARKDGRDVVLKLPQTWHWVGYILVHALRVLS